MLIGSLGVPGLREAAVFIGSGPRRASPEWSPLPNPPRRGEGAGKVVDGGAEGREPDGSN